MPVVQVIAIGYEGTGTASLQHALDQLGYKTFHSQMLLWERSDLLDVWHEHTTATAEVCPLDLSIFLVGYTAATGMLMAFSSQRPYCDGNRHVNVDELWLAASCLRKSKAKELEIDLVLAKKSHKLEADAAKK